MDKISEWLFKNQTRFANMSFGFGDAENPFGVGSDGRDSLVKLMYKNKQTLFVVAASNDGHDLDPELKTDVPPKAPVPNKIVVAALNTDRIELDKLESYDLADFSNFGENTVDIAAPGYEVESENIGGTMIRVSGTSMAAPYVLNTLLLMAEINTALNNEELLQLIKCTAYIPKTKHLKLKTRGIAIRDRAILAASLVQEKNVQKACLMANKKISL